MIWIYRIYDLKEMIGSKEEDWEEDVALFSYDESSNKRKLYLYGYLRIFMNLIIDLEGSLQEIDNFWNVPM